MRLPLFTACLIVSSSFNMSHAADKSDEHPIYGQTMTSLAGEPVDLVKYKEKVLLIVNTASECGYTPQYEGLQKLHETYGDAGLVVLGFPCNQFGAQEPGTSTEIAQFCKANYGVTFDMFSKVDVNGDSATPLYTFLTSAKSGLDDTGKIRWNFEKFLVSKDGRVLRRFRSGVEPESPDVVQAIESALK